MDAPQKTDGELKIPFQTSINTQPAPAVAGDFASANPRASVLAGPSALVAGAAGVTVGRFAWIDAHDQTLVTNSGPYGSVPTGFVHREQQALITTYLAETSNLIPAGFQMTLMSAGDYWVQNDGAGEINVGGAVWANFADGKAGGAAVTASGSASSVAASTFSVTGSISGNVMTVTAVGSGVVVPGGTISGTGVATGTMVVSQIGGTAGNIGTYYVSIPDHAAASTTISGTYGTLTVGGSVAGIWGVGQTITGSSVVAGTYISALGTGTGGAGTYIVTNNTVVSSTAITAALNVKTKYVAMTAAPAGGIFKMSSWLLG